ncbi:hypothetical protein FPZ12_012770 [Amycolatopsis acidicola]|uniref:Uncharacterized protein n=1 Tax=Amycolatopsis acidicola TaxID=2596893 RepID=A0A5N0VA05_9PSEU|nr:hypothetical protein [Amycolatopsis acidicola]KAA9162103.1 hypothetical protein FPZ12_012770 [Amycolatopsis acidicola]
MTGASRSARKAETATSRAIHAVGSGRENSVVAGTRATAGPSFTSTFDRAARISGAPHGSPRRRATSVAAASAAVTWPSTIA